VSKDDNALHEARDGAFKREIAELQRAVGAARSVISETGRRLTGIAEALLMTRKCRPSSSWSP